VVDYTTEHFQVGGENNGPSKQKGMKLQDMEFQDMKSK